MSDTISAFLFEDLDIRGSIVQLNSVWQTIQARRDYPLPVCELLGQICAVTVLVAANLKQPGRLTFQLSGQGYIPMLVVDCSESLNLRGYAKHEQLDARQPRTKDLLGNGQLVMSLDTQGSRQPYQSHVPIEGDKISDVFQNYLVQSEQQPAILILAADENRASGLFLQKLPGADLKDSDGWNRISMLARTIKDSELQDLDTIAFLRRIFAEETIRLFEARPVQHNFPENREKTIDMMRTLGETEVQALLAKHGEVVVTDDLSNHIYHFSPEEALSIFQEKPTMH